MIIQLLIAAADSDYTEYLSNVLSTKYTDKIAVGLCSSQEKLNDVLSARNYDVILIEPEWIPSLKRQSVKLVLALLYEQSSLSESFPNVVQIQKYQRISALVSEIFKHYENIAPIFENFKKARRRIFAVWSPAGGAGKTSVALAFATRSVSNGSVVTYLSFEHFSSSDLYFSNKGQNESSLFEKLKSNSEFSIQDIRQHDDRSGIEYFYPTDNYDDINKLTKDDMVYLINNCAHASDIVVVDLPSICDERIKAVLELADIVLLVMDKSKTSNAKLNVFVSQYNVFENIKNKIRLVSNKGANLIDSRFERIIKLPRVQNFDSVSVYKALSENSFDV